jgi:hypothetical protein
MAAAEHQQHGSHCRNQRAMCEAGRLEVLEVIPPPAHPLNCPARLNVTNSNVKEMMSTQD